MNAKYIKADRVEYTDLPVYRWKEQIEYTRRTK